MNELVTVVTPTTGSKYLRDVIESVQDQTYNNIQHLIFVDGVEHEDKVNSILNAFPYFENIDLIYLKYPTGKDRFNGHRIYGASPYLAKGEYICFLDEDNWYDPDHIESLFNAIQNKGWSYSLRKIIDSDGNYVCNDMCESLGEVPTVLNEKDHLVDVNCFMLTRNVALQTSPIWYRKAREPGVPEVDRFLTHVLLNNNIPYGKTNKYSVNYRVGNTELSVKAEFFLEGNKIMNERYNGNCPWQN